MQTIKKVGAGIGIAIITAVIGGIISFLSEAHLELSFAKLKDFKVTEISSYMTLLTSIKVDLEENEPKLYLGYFGELKNEVPTEVVPVSGTVWRLG